MPSDPSGRYKGSNYDPHWSTKRSNGGPSGSGSGPPAFSSDSNSASASTRNRQNHYGSNGPTSAPIQPQMTGREYGYSNGYVNGNGRRSPRSPSPTKRNIPVSTGLTPTGPASMKTKLPPKVDQWSSASTRNSVIDATTSEYTTAPETHPDPNPKAEGTTSTSTEVNSPSYKVHPSRLSLVPQATPSVSSPLNPTRTPNSASTNTPSRDDSNRSSRPAPLNLTPAGTPKEAIKTPATASWSPSLVLSPATKSPLDSLDKLRRFKEQVAASRKSVNSMSGLEMSKLAQVAEKFLKSQDPAASDDAYEELVKLTGSREEGSSRPSESADKPPPPATPAPPAPPATDGPQDVNETVQSAAARAAILKERLLASKRDGSSQSPRDRDAPKRADSNIETMNASAGTKRDREDRPENENEEQKRYRAAVWAHQKPAEPVKRDQQQDKDRQPVRSKREEGEWDGYDSRSSVPQPPRMERQLSLHERISDRTRHESHDRGRGHGHRRVSRSPSRQDRHGRDDHSRPTHASSEHRPHEAHSVPAPRGPSGYSGRDVSKNEYTHNPRPTPGKGGDGWYRSTDAGAAAAVVARTQDEAAYEARRRARMASLQSSPTRSDYSRSRPSAPPPQTYARSVAEPRGYREDSYTRPSTSEYNRPQESAPPPAPAAPVAAAPAVIDPATVLATLDVLKAQIASLEKLLPAVLPTVVTTPVPAPAVAHGYACERDHRLPPLPPPPPHLIGHGYGLPLPPPPPPRGYGYDFPPPPPPPPHELHNRIGTESWLNRPPARKERGGPYKERNGDGYKGRDEYHDDHGHGHGRGGKARGGRGGGGGGRGGGRGESRGRLGRGRCGR